MKRQLGLVFLLVLLAATRLLAQSKMVVGKQHTILVSVPGGWLPASHPQLPFFIKPDQPAVSARTYIYVYGLDYPSNPRLEEWIAGNNQAVLDGYRGTKIDTLGLVLPAIKAGNYLTGRYQTIRYHYPDGRQEALLVIECKHTIATVVLSATSQAEFSTLLPSFKELAATIRVLGTTLQEE